MGRHEDLLLDAQNHLRAGAPDRALASLARILRDRPGHVEALTVASLAHKARADHVRAVHFARQALAARESVETRMGLAFMLAWAGQRDEAARTLEPLVACERPFPPACFRYARLLQDLGRSDESERLAAGWCERFPDVPQMVQARCEALARLGDVPALLAALREGRRRFPDNRAFAEWLASAALYADDIPENEVLALAREHAGMLPRAPAPERRPRSGPVRIGFLSPDLRTHSVSYFIRPLLTHLDRARFASYLYDTGDEPDATTEALRALGAGYAWCRPLRDDEVVTRVRADGVDVLFDLAGLTRGATPGVPALRAAPVQASFLGYANFTCLPGIDFRVGDSTTDPPGSHPPGAEALVRLDPCFVCYAPPDLPPVRQPRREGVAFGSFNALPKVSPACVALWSRVLREVPGSRLVVKAWGLECEAARRRLRGAFGAHGVEASRLDLRPLAATAREHLDQYHDVDVALDTFPYHGTTTTCEALVMGVPVVTLAGSVHRSRVGASLLSAAGLADHVATDEESFVARAATLAREGVRTARAREDLRRRVLGSTLCDGAAYARRFEAMVERECGARGARRAK